MLNVTNNKKDFVMARNSRVLKGFHQSQQELRSEWSQYNKQSRNIFITELYSDTVRPQPTIQDIINLSCRKVSDLIRWTPLVCESKRFELVGTSGVSSPQGNAVSSILRKKFYTLMPPALPRDLQEL